MTGVGVGGAAPGSSRFDVLSPENPAIPQIRVRRVNNDPDLVVDQAGNTGLGTASPSDRLHVSDGGAIRQDLLSTNAYMQMVPTDTSIQYHISPETSFKRQMMEIQDVSVLFGMDATLSSGTVNIEGNTP